MKQYLEDYLQDIELKQIFKDIVGTADAIQIQSIIEHSLLNHLHVIVEKLLFIQSSIGVVFGFLLSNGQQVVLKVYSGKISHTYLEKMNKIQNIFYQDNFPAPQVLSPIFPFGHTLAGLYTLIEGTKEDAHKPLIRIELAQHLAKFTDIVDKHRLLPLKNFFQQTQEKRLWPIAHNVLFNLKKTSRGAGWIANKAIEARKILQATSLPLMLAHTDWGVKNAIFNHTKLCGIFDWDSLGEMSEPEMVGRAAAQFTADWELGLKITPSPNESRLFIEAYQEFKHKTFTQDEFKIMSAAADSLIATIARFEHAGGGAEHPYQDLLRECGNKSFLFS